jgi:serine phosphatase RsbU (regulator of sigma subunit)
MAVIRDHSDEPTKVILEEVFDALDRFRFPAERKDDETLVAIKVL